MDASCAEASALAAIARYAAAAYGSVQRWISRHGALAAASLLRIFA